jgi:hypothetical protein
MFKMAKAFGKTIKTEEQIKIYSKLKETKLEIKKTKEEKNALFTDYCNLEGKYSNGTKTDPWAGQGFRGWFYTYETPELRLKEEKEREEFYNEKIKPLSDRIDRLFDEVEEINEQLCIALWGYGRDKYYKMDNIERAKRRIENYEKEIEKEKEYIEKLLQEI